MSGLRYARPVTILVAVMVERPSIGSMSLTVSAWMLSSVVKFLMRSLAVVGPRPAMLSDMSRR